ncbi:pantothenate kinase [Pseudomonas taeanensis MS-3]|uniref:Type III pantothenate kinase n=1 Tax=Pseudomonas taeanensis MS-3 TaxID=1395571 RepID=A0A0A1YG77_9PSED|nr:pantothenate kinase [Pseudomonas taeanensis]KFX67654.1 pantothenate kinase [Pseudomonas taeanensis MS-3]
MILELDCGNSFIKWRLVSGAASKACCGGVVGSGEELVLALREQPVTVLGCRLVSVRTDEETSCLVDALERAFAIKCVCARPAAELAGVRNGYEQYERLGLDRWLALVGAYHQVHRACLVLDLGTAVTSDFVDADGGHLGGFICPGVPLMRNQLRTHTRRIRYDDVVAELAMKSLSPGRSTAEAVERGCSLMLQGFVHTQLDLARECLGESFEVFLTGGDASLVADIIPSARVMPDLVFIGLAMACPLG